MLSRVIVGAIFCAGIVVMVFSTTLELTVLGYFFFKSELLTDTCDIGVINVELEFDFDCDVEIEKRRALFEELTENSVDVVL